MGGYTSITGAIRQYSNLSTPRLLTTTLNQLEAATIEGDVFDAKVSWRAVPSTTSITDEVTTADRFLKIQTPGVETGKTIGIVLRSIKADLGGVEYQVFLGATGESVVRTITPSNLNGASSNTSDMVIEEVTLATITTPIASSLDFIPGIGQSTPGLASSGSAASVQSFQIFPSGGTFYARLRNKAGAVNNLIQYELLWIEAPPEIISQP